MQMKNQLEVRTIVAPSTPNGVSAIAVVRVSGPQVQEVLRQVLGKDLEKGSIRVREMTRAGARDPRTGEPLDDLMCCVFLGPKSYTGEDVLEIFPHGNPLLVRHLVEAIRSVAGVRLADPGEFTRRAFEAGKIDLVQAEAIGQLLHATVESGLRNAERLLAGRLSQQITSLVEAVKKISALLELEVDFAEEEADADQRGWQEQLYAICTQLRALKKNFRSEATENRTPAVVFYGAPNAGKSSLVNALLCDDRLLVSPKAGTTRDVVEVLLLLDRGEVRLMDTAGISSSPVDELDMASQQKARARIAQADLAIMLVEQGTPFLPPENPSHWVVQTKADLFDQKSVGDGTAVSAHSSWGIAEFLQRLEAHLFPPQEVREEFWMASERQLACLENGLAGVERALAHLQSGRSAPEELAFELFGVRESLAGITGQITTDAILDVIFSKFCIGK